MNPESIFWPAAVLLLAIMGTAQVTSVLQECQSFDESTHLAAGYSYLATGDFRMNPEHPPLAKILAALPLLPLQPDLPLGTQAWSIRDELEFGITFLYANRVPARTLLFPARCVTIFISLCLGLAVAVWTRRRFGAATALFALLLFAFDPNLIANGRYVTTDMHLALFLFLAIIAWDAFLRSRRTWRLIASGAAMGLALASKFSAPFVAVLFVLLYCLKWWQEGAEPEPGRRPLSFGHLAGSLVVVAILSAALIAVCYGPETIRLAADKTEFVPLESRVDRATLTGKFLYLTAEFLDLPAHSYFLGLNDAARHDRVGHPAYLLGRVSGRGWWYYFPIAFAVKTPSAVLVLLLLCLCLPAGRLFRRPRLPALRKLPFHWYVLAAPPIAYFAASMIASVNIGLRHILPIYPFLFIWLSAVLFQSRLGLRRRLFAAILCVLAGLEIAESAAIYPHYLAFFNWISGGPAKGPDYLVDSNIDWGQDLIKLQNWWAGQGKPRVCLDYFGSAPLWYYGFPRGGLPGTWDAVGREQLDCFVAISATVLKDIYVKPGKYQWLRERKPAARIGYSIYIYDLRRRS